MSLLRTIETRISRAVEGAFGKVFRSNVQPVELARRLVKEMDDHQQRTVRKVYVPNVYEVFLSPDDHRQFREYEAALVGELAEYLAEHARRSGYAVLTRPTVTLQRDRDLDLGSFGIATRMEGTPDEEAGSGGRAAAALDHAASSTMVYRAPIDPGAGMGGTDDTVSGYGVFGPGGPFPIATQRISIGRGKVNDLVVNDASVSREHAEIVRHGDGGFLVRDLGSTNGVLVNGSRVREQELAVGDRIVLGNIELRFDRLDDGAAGS